MRTLTVIAAALALAAAFAGASAQAPAVQEYRYGGDTKQRLDLARPDAPGRAPILFHVHGGGWAIGDKSGAAGSKPSWAVGQGWAFANANYRLVPQVRVEQQAADLALALAWLRANASRHGLDPDRIVLMGHSAGAHLVALLGTNPAYLRDAGVPLAAIRGVILLDGAGYDIPTQMQQPRPRLQRIYRQAFGDDPERQAALSPVSHSAAPNVPRWLILPVASRAASMAQSEALATALRAAGATATVAPQAGKTHLTINRDLGRSGDSTTELVERFLAESR